jgi:hypothetical protein
MVSGNLMNVTYTRDDKDRIIGSYRVAPGDPNNYHVYTEYRYDSLDRISSTFSQDQKADQLKVEYFYRGDSIMSVSSRGTSAIMVFHNGNLETVESSNGVGLAYDWYYDNPSFMAGNELNFDPIRGIIYDPLKSKNCLKGYVVWQNYTAKFSVIFDEEGYPIELNNGNPKRLFFQRLTFEYYD